MDDEHSKLVKCQNCSDEVTSDSDFCPHCGVLFAETGEVCCDLHPLEFGIGVCIICRKVCCEECGTTVRKRFFCTAHRKVQVEEDWAEVFRATDIGEAELVKSVLESAGQKVLVENFNSIGFVWDGGGDSPISRSNLNKPAKVFVPIPEYLNAIQIVQEWKSSEKDVYLDGSEYSE
jgi:RNA polymerase subunit RPABC4/transcription elongation factor Spt4